jgi:glycine cleavage system H protein
MQQSFTRDHLWVAQLDDDKVRIGISEVLAESLGDIDEVNLPEQGEGFSIGDPFAEIGGSGGKVDLYIPVEGVISEINESLFDSPERLSEDPLETWLIELEEIGEMEELLSESEYLSSINED